MRTAKNYINGQWVAGSGPAHKIHSPSSGNAIGEVTFADGADIDAAVAAAREAFPGWRDTPIPERIRYLFALREKMNAAFDDLARTIVEDEGKTIEDARGEVRRGLENVEVACGAPLLMSGESLDSIAPGIDSTVTFYPLGVSVIIGPFNFPLMVPMWFLPYAIACGNTVVVKPSEQVPLAMIEFMRLLDQVGLPPGVVNLVNGGRETVEALVEHPDVESVSFVGSEAVARRVYQLATSHGKRAQCLGGAKNYLVVMPDADVEQTRSAVVASAFGGAGERCLAGSVLVPVGEGSRLGEVRDAVIESASAIRVGDGLDPSNQLGPVVSRDHQTRVLQHIDTAIGDGASALLDGRSYTSQPGYYIGPTVLDGVSPDQDFAGTEVFGPVLGVMHAPTVEDALTAISRTRYGNAASIFTSSGRSAREFIRSVPCGMVGVNVGVAAPMAYFPFTGWRQSFFGDLQAQGRDSIRFFTRPRVAITRW
ncbi:MAG: CoA-acylating methylmalonate-semialdehyde dehydrogenase [Dehalococcoidia bacterium]|nr:CoA-acylating methylmalonate-semialdehyde dehydrogenase [Dehalococcoidia bacterium]